MPAPVAVALGVGVPVSAWGVWHGASGDVLSQGDAAAARQQHQQQPGGADGTRCSAWHLAQLGVGCSYKYNVGRDFDDPELRLYWQQGDCIQERTKFASRSHATGQVDHIAYAMNNTLCAQLQDAPYRPNPLVLAQSSREPLSYLLLLLLLQLQRIALVKGTRLRRGSEVFSTRVENDT